jgi:hypothetical protein
VPAGTLPPPEAPVEVPALPQEAPTEGAEGLLKPRWDPPGGAQG